MVQPLGKYSQSRIENPKRSFNIPSEFKITDVSSIFFWTDYKQGNYSLWINKSNKIILNQIQEKRKSMLDFSAFI